MLTTRSLPANREPTHPGEILRHEFRRPLGLTQEALAAALGMDRPAYSAIENGRRSITPKLAVKLERVLRVPAVMWLSMQTDVDLYRALHGPDRVNLRKLQPIVRVEPTEDATPTRLASTTGRRAARITDIR